VKHPDGFYRYSRILALRGVPEAFIEPVAARSLPTYAWMLGVSILWIVGVVVFFLIHKDPLGPVLGQVYADRIGHADLFFPGTSFVLLEAAGYVGLFLLPIFLCFLIPFIPRAKPGSRRAKDDAAAYLRAMSAAEGKSGIRKDPVLIGMAGLPDADAFLARVAETYLGPTSGNPKMRATMRYVAIGLFAFPICLFALAHYDYSRIESGRIERRFLGMDYAVPLTAIDGIALDCAYHSGKGGGWREDYDIVVHGTSLNLFGADDPIHPLSSAQHLSQMRTLDAYFTRTFGPIRRVSPSDAEGCIKGWRDTDQPAVRALLTGQG
jgi:hypothetical protein